MQLICWAGCVEMRFQEWLQANTVNDILLSKTCTTDTVLTISRDDTIWNAMWAFGHNEISAIAVYTTVEDEKEKTMATRRYEHILTINDVLEYLYNYLEHSRCKPIPDEELKDTCFNLRISEYIRLHRSEHHPQPIFVKSSCNLRNLVEIWIGKSAYTSSHRVFVGSETDLQDVLTITDFIHYCFVNSHQIQDVLQAHALPALFPGTKTPSPLGSSGLVEDTETAWVALRKLLDHAPTQVVGVLDNYTGNLIGYLSSMDFLPCCFPDEIFKVISHLNEPVSTFINLVCKTPSRAIDAVTFRDNMTLEQLIERLLKLRVHLLWRFSFTGQIIGVVTAIDVLRYFKRCADSCK